MAEGKSRHQDAPTPSPVLPAGGARCAVAPGTRCTAGTSACPRGRAAGWWAPTARPGPAVSFAENQEKKGLLLSDCAAAHLGNSVPGRSFRIPLGTLLYLQAHGRRLARVHRLAL